VVALSPQQSKKAKFSPFSRWQALWLRHVIGFIPLELQEKTSSISHKHSQNKRRESIYFLAFFHTVKPK